MKKLILIFSAFFLVFNASAAEYLLDKPHTNIGFTVTHLVITDVVGQFREFTTKVDFDENTKKLASVSAVIQTNSVDTDNEKRDKHLRSPDFFDAKKYPTIQFKSTKINRNGNKYKIVGMLTMKDVTKKVTFKGKLKGIVKNSKKFGTRIGLEATTTINRQDYNLAFNKKSDLGDKIVGDEIEILIKAEFIKKK